MACLRFRLGAHLLLRTSLHLSGDLLACGGFHGGAHLLFAACKHLTAHFFARGFGYFVRYLLPGGGFYGGFNLFARRVLHHASKLAIRLTADIIIHIFKQFVL